MRDILSRITKWWEAGETFGLATVVRTYRSAPRDPGAALAVSSSADHEVVGSVSGGCVEGAVYELSLDVCRTSEPVLQTYGVSDDDAFAVGLTCGGIIDIFVEPVDQARFPELGQIAEAVERGEPVAVATVIAGPARSARGGSSGPATVPLRTGPRRTVPTAGIPVRLAPWDRRGWTRRSMTTSAACWPRG